MKTIDGMAALAPGYDALLCDLWGVVIDGHRAIASACEALQRFRAKGGRVALLSNAPRPSEAVVRQLDGFGVPRGAYDTVVTSGDTVREALLRRPDDWHRALGRRCHHLGPPHNRPLLDGLDLELETAVEHASFVLCTGLGDGATETPADYAGLLRAARARALKLLCANPDLAVMRGPMKVRCAGALAEAYAALGGEVRHYGKPHANVYELCFAHLGPVDRRRVLAIGDGLHTDIAGAAGIGVDALFVWDGIHRSDIGAAPSEQAAAQLCAAHGLAPKAVIERLTW